MNKLAKEPMFSVTRAECDWSYTKGTGAGGQKKTKLARPYTVHIALVVLMAIQNLHAVNWKIAKRLFAKWPSQIVSSVGHG